MLFCMDCISLTAKFKLAKETPRINLCTEKSAEKSPMQKMWKLQKWDPHNLSLKRKKWKHAKMLGNQQ